MIIRGTFMETSIYPPFPLSSNIQPPLSVRAAAHVSRTAIQAPVHAVALVVGARHCVATIAGVEDPRPVALGVFIDS